MKHIPHIKPGRGAHVGGAAGLVASTLTGRRYIRVLVESTLFERVIEGVILFNCVVMAATYLGEPEWWRILQLALNEICTLIFTGEAVLKIYGLNWIGYWFVHWNKFDFCIVIAAWVDLFCRLLDIAFVNGAVFRVVRILKVIGRVGRLLRVSNSVQGVQIITDTFVVSLPSLFYLGLLVALIIFIMAILGVQVTHCRQLPSVPPLLADQQFCCVVQLLGTIQINTEDEFGQTSCLTYLFNFQDALAAMMVLLTLTTGDRFTCMLHSCSMLENKETDNCNQEDGTCGHPIWARLYFTVYSLLIILTTLQLFVNV